MKKLLPIDIIKVKNRWNVVCIYLPVFKPSMPFFVDDLYTRFPEIFSSGIEKSNTTFLKKMYYKKNSKIRYFPIEKYIKKFSKLESKKKLGFIHHLSRCGSTLFCNLLKVHKHTVVYSEPTIINSILDFGKELPPNTKTKLIKSSINLLSNFSSEDTTNVFIKFRCWNVFFIENIYEAMGNVPTIYIHRNGLEILKSILDLPCSWLRAKNVYANKFTKIIGFSPKKIKEMKEDEYVTRMLGALLKKVLNFKKQKIIGLDYVNLKKDFLKISKDIYSLKFDKKELVKLKKQMTKYSKDHRKVFVNDIHRKQTGYSKKIKNLNIKEVESLRKKLVW